MSTQGTSKAHMVFEALREDILNGTIGPNERLVERDLVERFSVSKTPVREALTMLRNEGLAKGRYYRGVTAVHLSARTLHELYELREVLEGLAARRTAENSNARAIEELTSIVREQESAMFTDRWCRLNVRFHQEILDFSGSFELSKTLGKLYDQDRVLASSTLNTPLDQPRAAHGQGLLEHKGILAAIVNADPVAAEERARRHVRDALARLKEGGA